jgi:hypothetical protein
MSIDLVHRPTVTGHPARLAAAVDTIATRLPQPVVPQTMFDLEQRTHIRSSHDHRVWARRNEALGVWVIGCESTSPETWSSGVHRCEGCLSAEDALERAEALWRCRQSALNAG